MRKPRQVCNFPGQAKFEDCTSNSINFVLNCFLGGLLLTLETLRHHVYVKRQTLVCTTWPSFSFTCRFLFIISTHEKLVVSRNFLSIGIVLSCFYLLISYFEKFSTWIWRLPFAVCHICEAQSLYYFINRRICWRAVIIFSDWIRRTGNWSVDVHEVEIVLVPLAIAVPFFSFVCLKNFKKIISGSANVVLRICQGFWKSDELFFFFVAFFFIVLFVVSYYSLFIATAKYWKKKAVLCILSLG